MPSFFQPLIPPSAFLLIAYVNIALRRIFGSKRDEERVVLRRLHNEKLRALYSSNFTRVIKSRRLKLVGHEARTGVRRSAYSVLVGKPEGRPLGRPSGRWEDNIKMYLPEVALRGMDGLDRSGSG
jgi:hypothetical protein